MILARVGMLFISDPSRNTRRIAELSDSEHVQLILRDISHFFELFSALMDLGAQGHMFCYALKFKTLYELLVGKVEEAVKHEEVMEFEDRATQRATLFETEAKALC